MRPFAWLARRLTPPPDPALPPPVPRWAVVADAARGTGPFAPGTRLTVVGVYWGMKGDTVTVVGRHPQSGHFLTVGMPTRHLANVRPELVSHPHVVRQVEQHAEFTQYPADSPEAVVHAAKVADRLAVMSAGTQAFRR